MDGSAINKMPSYTQKIKVPASHYTEATAFLDFLQATGRGHTPIAKLNYRYLGRGYFAITIAGEGLDIDSLLRELLLNKGLFYYACSIKTRKTETIDQVIVPIFQDLLEERFQNPYSRSLRRHIRGKISSGQAIPGDLSEPFSHEYEVLFTRWSGGALSDWDFIQDLDALLTKFMLTKLSHPVGARSPVFPALVKRTHAKGVGMAEELMDVFNNVHALRTRGLHRLQTKFSKEEMSEVSGRLYNYFQYFDEFDASQRERTEMLHGTRFRRIRYGDEKWTDENGEPYEDDWSEITANPCHDCAAIRGQFHCSGCDVEQCARCKGQRLGCPCKLAKDFG
jgi:hypothetical protein